MPSIMGTAVNDNRQGVVPIHTNTRGAIPVETMVSPFANSRAEYAPTKCSGGLHCEPIADERSAGPAVHQC